MPAPVIVVLPLAPFLIDFFQPLFLGMAHFRSKSKRRSSKIPNKSCGCRFSFKKDCLQEIILCGKSEWQHQQRLLLLVLFCCYSSSSCAAASTSTRVLIETNVKWQQRFGLSLAIAKLPSHLRRKNTSTTNQKRIFCVVKIFEVEEIYQQEADPISTSAHSTTLSSSGADRNDTNVALVVDSTSSSSISSNSAATGCADSNYFQ